MPACLRTGRSTSSSTITAPIKTPLICAWFAKRPRFHVHFTPTYGSAKPGGTLVRGTHDETDSTWRPSQRQRVRARIQAFLDAHNVDPKPFVWTNSADEILSSNTRACALKL